MTPVVEVSVTPVPTLTAEACVLLPIVPPPICSVAISRSFFKSSVTPYVTSMRSAFSVPFIVMVRLAVAAP